MRKGLKCIMVLAVFLVCLMIPVQVEAAVTSGTMGPNNGMTWNYDSSTKTLTLSGVENDFGGELVGNAIVSPFVSICPDVEHIIVQNSTFSGGCYRLFAELKSVRTITFRNVNTAQMTDMYSMFCDCTNLESVDMGGLNTANVTDMSEMFWGCSSLQSVNLAGWNTNNVYSLRYMFSGCESLTSLDLSSFHTPYVEEMGQMFDGCSSLEYLDISNFDTSNVWFTTNMFTGCAKLKELDLGHFNTQYVYAMDQMFSGCSSLETLDISGFDTKRLRYMSEMFKGCTALKQLNLGSFELDIIEEYQDVFTGCSNLNVIDTPKSVKEGVSVALPAAFHTMQGGTVNALSSTCENSTLMKNIPASGRNVVLSAPKGVTKITIDNALQMTLTVEGQALPASDYRFYHWTVSNPAVLSVSDLGVVKGVAMGTASVTGTHKFQPAETVSYEFTIEVPFKDVKATDWQYPYVVYAYENNLMGGKGEGEFDIVSNITRSEFVTVLHSNANKPMVTYEQNFTDVSSDKWFANAVTWARQEGISAGNPNGTFGVYDPITREQLVLMLYQYAKSNDVSTDGITEQLSSFADTSRVSNWAAEAMKWGVQNSIIGGKNKADGTYLDPQGKTTRGECATMMMRYVELTK